MCSTSHLFSLPNDVALALFRSLTSSLVFLVYQIFPISVHSVVFPITKKQNKTKQINEQLFFYYPSVIPFISFLYNRNPQRNCLYSLSSFTLFVLSAQCLQWIIWVIITVNVHVFFTSWLVQVDWLSWVGHLHRWTQAASQLALLLWHLCPQHSASRVTTKWRAGAGAQRNFGAGLLRVGTYPSVHILVSENWVPGPQHNFKGGWKMSQCAQKKDMDKPVFC